MLYSTIKYVSFIGSLFLPLRTTGQAIASYTCPSSSVCDVPCSASVDVATGKSSVSSEEFELNCGNASICRYWCTCGVSFGTLTVNMQNSVNFEMHVEDKDCSKQATLVINGGDGVDLNVSITSSDNAELASATITAQNAANVWIKAGIKMGTATIDASTAQTLYVVGAQDSFKESTIHTPSHGNAFFSMSEQKGLKNVIVNAGTDGAIYIDCSSPSASQSDCQDIQVNAENARYLEVTSSTPASGVSGTITCPPHNNACVLSGVTLIYPIIRAQYGYPRNLIVNNVIFDTDMTVQCGSSYTSWATIYSYSDLQNQWSACWMTAAPTKAPSAAIAPTITKAPTKQPTALPTLTPTKAPTKIPTKTPTKIPTATPTKTPTKIPITTPKTPTLNPTSAPVYFSTSAKQPAAHPASNPVAVPPLPTFTGTTSTTPLHTQLQTTQQVEFPATQANESFVTMMAHQLNLESEIFLALIVSAVLICLCSVLLCCLCHTHWTRRRKNNFDHKRPSKKRSLQSKSELPSRSNKIEMQRSVPSHSQAHRDHAIRDMQALSSLQSEAAMHIAVDDDSDEMSLDSIILQQEHKQHLQYQQKLDRMDAAVTPRQAPLNLAASNSYVLSPKSLQVQMAPKSAVANGKSPMLAVADAQLKAHSFHANAQAMYSYNASYANNLQLQNNLSMQMADAYKPVIAEDGGDDDDDDYPDDDMDILDGIDGYFVNPNAMDTCRAAHVLSVVKLDRPVSQLSGFDDDEELEEQDTETPAHGKVNSSDAMYRKQIEFDTESVTNKSAVSGCQSEGLVKKKPAPKKPLHRTCSKNDRYEPQICQAINC